VPLPRLGDKSDFIDWPLRRQGEKTVVLSEFWHLMVKLRSKPGFDGKRRWGYPNGI
jgi:hypothetical protein